MEVGERITGAEVVTIGRGGEVRDLPSADVDPSAVTGLAVHTDAYGPTTVEGVLAHSQARSLVVLHDGRIAFEWYGPGGDPDRRNRCYSVTKSFTGTLAALAFARRAGSTGPRSSATCCPSWPRRGSGTPPSATWPT